jgi:2-methylaconitate cis-trans-isomerase PrpF
MASTWITHLWWVIVLSERASNDVIELALLSPCLNNSKWILRPADATGTGIAESEHDDTPPHPTPQCSLHLEMGPDHIFPSILFCGSLSAAVGPFAVNEGLVHAERVDSHQRSDTQQLALRVLQTNTHGVFETELPVRVTEQGQLSCHGSLTQVQPSEAFVMAGVSSTSSAPVTLDYLNTSGLITGCKGVLPTGKCVDHVMLQGNGVIRVSIVDASTLVVYVTAEEILSSLGRDECTHDFLAGTADSIDANEHVMLLLEEIRKSVQKQLGLPEASLMIPRIAMVGKPSDFTATDGNCYSASEYSIITRMLSLGKVHKSIMGTGMMNLGVACQVPGTVCNEQIPKCSNNTGIRIAHPSGVTEVRADVVNLGDGSFDATRVQFVRTARPLMRGEVYTDLEGFV